MFIAKVRMEQGFQYMKNIFTYSILTDSFKFATLKLMSYNVATSSLALEFLYL